MSDHKTLHLAREWAKAIDRGEEFVSQDWIDAAADTINALPDEWVDADKVRELSALLRKDVKMGEQYDLGNAFDKGHTSASRWIAGALDNLLPSPPRKPAMIKRGATAWHDELGEVTILSNKPNRGAGLAAVTDLVRVAADWDEGDDGSQVATVNASSLTAPDEGLVDSGAPETNNDSAEGEGVDDSPAKVIAQSLSDMAAGRVTDFTEDTITGFDKSKRYRDSWGDVWEWNPNTDEWECRGDGGSTLDTEHDLADSVHAPFTVVDESVPPTRSFPTGAHYDSEGNATEPEDVEPGEAWQVITRYHDEPHPAIKSKADTWVFLLNHGFSTWEDDRNIELVAPLVPKPEPRVLGTFKDYQDAAIGTIVRVDDPDTYFNAWKKTSANLWQSTAGYKQDNNEMSGTSRTTIWEPAPYTRIEKEKANE